jgi:hypothetical protein
MRSGQMGGDVNWFVKQFIEELKNEWSDFTFEMLLATVEEEANISSEELNKRWSIKRRERSIFAPRSPRCLNRP